MRNIFRIPRWRLSPFDLMVYVLWGVTLLGYWRGINNKIPFFKNYTDELEIAIVVVPIVLALPQIVKRIKPIDLIFCIGFALLYLLNYVFYPENHIALDDRLLRCLFTVVPFFIYGRMLDIDRYYKGFYRISAFTILLTVFYDFSYAQNVAVDVDTENYNMSASYNLLPHVLFVLWATFKKQSLENIGLSILGIFQIIAYGTRGPLVCALVFFTLYALIFSDMKYARLIKGLIVAMGIAVSMFFYEIAIFLQLQLQNFGMSTRIVDKIIEDELTDGTGREWIAETLYDILENSHNICGYGLLGAERYVGTYPHKIYLEFMFSFGYVVGILLLFAVVLLIAKAFIKASQINKEFILLLVCGSVVKLCMSGTFLDDTIFFMLLGNCAQMLMRKKSLLYNWRR